MNSIGALTNPARRTSWACFLVKWIVLKVIIKQQCVR